MLVFEPPVSMIPTDPSEALIDTPLGTLAFRALENGEPFAVAETFVGEDGVELRRYIHPSAEIEMLLFPFVPKIPEHLRVDACLAAVWRVRAPQDISSVILRAEWEPHARNEDGGYDGGEHLMSLAWDAPGVRLSVGTSDEEMLLATATRGELLPKRLAAIYDALVARPVEHEAFAANQRYMPRAVRERDGLEVELPPLLAGERAQIHFVVAWRTGEFHWQDVSTWYAVDLSPDEVARMADEALGGGSDWGARSAASPLRSQALSGVRTTSVPSASATATWAPLASAATTGAGKDHGVACLRASTVRSPTIRGRPDQSAFTRATPLAAYVAPTGSPVEKSTVPARPPASSEALATRSLWGPTSNAITRPAIGTARRQRTAPSSSYATMPPSARAATSDGSPALPSCRTAMPTTPSGKVTAFPSGSPAAS